MNNTWYDFNETYDLGVSGKPSLAIFPRALYQNLYGAQEPIMSSSRKKTGETCDKNHLGYKGVGATYPGSWKNAQTRCKSSLGGGKGNISGKGCVRPE